MKIRKNDLAIRIFKLVLSVSAVLIITKLTLKLGDLTSTATAAFSFLIIIMLSAFFSDLVSAIITSLVAALCFDFFYLPPVGTLHIEAFSDWISLSSFILSATLISYLTASADKNKSYAANMSKTMSQIKNFGEWLISVPQEELTLSDIARETLRIFCLEYCSIHVYEEGKWQHYSGSASSQINEQTEGHLKYLKDHPTDLLELADENAMDVAYFQISRKELPAAFLGVKSKDLPAEAIGTIAYMIGVRICSFPKK